MVHAYPSGGGSYEVVSTNLGPTAGLVVAAWLLVDYVMTVAVSVASGVDNIISAVPRLADHRVLMAISFVAVLTAMNLQGVRESGRAFAARRHLLHQRCPRHGGHGPDPLRPRGRAGRRERRVRRLAGPLDANLTGLALLMLVLRAFSSGCTALTGVEAISNGVPAFRKPGVRGTRPRH